MNRANERSDWCAKRGFLLYSTDGELLHFDKDANSKQKLLLSAFSKIDVPRNIDLSRYEIRGLELYSKVFYGTNMTNVLIETSAFTLSTFKNATFKNSKFVHCDFSFCEFIECDLENAYFIDCIFRHATFEKNNGTPRTKDCDFTWSSCALKKSKLK